MKKDKKFCSVLFKLRTTILIFSFLFILSIFLILSIHYKKVVLNDAVLQLQNEDEIISQSIANRIQNTKSYCNTIIIHLNESLNGKFMNNGYPFFDSETQKKIYTCMINTFTMFYDAEQVMVVWNDGKSYYQNRTENYSMHIEEDELLQEMRDRLIDRSGSWLTRINADCKIQGEGQYYAKAYADIDTGKVKGYIIFKINDIFDIIDNKGYSHRKFYLFDQKGYLIQTSDTLIKKQIFKNSNSEEQLILSQDLKAELTKIKSNSRQNIDITVLNNKWMLVSVTDLKETLNGLYRTIMFIMFISIMIMGVLCYILNYILVRIVKPIQTLSQHMISFQTELPSQIEMKKRNDEIGILVSHFNVMALKNQTLFELVLEEKQQQKHLEFALLQMQIKPHFLYNTLDTIYCLVGLRRYQEASKVTKLLSDYYRHILSKGLDWVPLSEEIEQVEKYLEIQSVRYSNVLSYSIYFESGADIIKIPKLTLQPLVENAIYHGIKPSNHKGCLDIKVTQENQRIEIRVIDDGVGLSKENFDEIMKEDKSLDSGFGLRNVVDRLGLYYGDKCKVILEEKEIGTSILIQIQNL